MKVGAKRKKQDEHGFLIGSHPICCYVREIADGSFDVNSNGQCIPQNCVLDEQIFIIYENCELWEMHLKNIPGEGLTFGPPNIYTMVTPLPNTMLDVKYR